jgi:hypothetical protein
VLTLVWVGGIHRHGGGVPIVVEQPIQRPAPVVLVLLAGGGVGGVGSGEVVKPVPAWRGFVQEVGVLELFEQPARLRQGGVQ